MSDGPEAAPMREVSSRLLSRLVVVLGGAALAGLFWWFATPQPEPPSPMDWRPPIAARAGSGQVGTTFVTTMKSGPEALPLGLEHRLSYFAVGRKLDITPGQQEGASSDLETKTVPYGRLLDETHLLNCFNCHVTTTSERNRRRLDTATMIPNVTCERCHGPGGAHIEAARRGEGENALRMSLGL